jgi:hypothetical protein
VWALKTTARLMMRTTQSAWAASQSRVVDTVACCHCTQHHVHAMATAGASLAVRLPVVSQCQLLVV